MALAVVAKAAIQTATIHRLGIDLAVIDFMYQFSLSSSRADVPPQKACAGIDMVNSYTWLKRRRNFRSVQGNKATPISQEITHKQLTK
jgi:hypothetical protein